MNWPLDYEAVKALAKDLDRPLKSAIALSDDNDPYLANRPGARLDRARWFTKLWREIDPPQGVHLRRLHYILVSTTSISLPNGAPYLNAHRCWKLLGSAACDARYLDLVPAGAFDDRRAPSPIIFIPPQDEAGTITVSRNEPDVVADYHRYLPDEEPPGEPGDFVPLPLTRHVRRSFRPSLNSTRKLPHPIRGMQSRSGRKRPR